MPKIKTHSSSKKRFRLTASGKVRFNSALRRHRLISKPKSAKERNQGTKIMLISCIYSREGYTQKLIASA